MVNQLKKHQIHLECMFEDGMSDKTLQTLFKMDKHEFKAFIDELGLSRHTPTGAVLYAMHERLTAVTGISEMLANDLETICDSRRVTRSRLQSAKAEIARLKSGY
jgi:hypothetical protein